jgi:hypothetical protein
MVPVGEGPLFEPQASWWAMLQAVRERLTELAQGSRFSTAMTRFLVPDLLPRSADEDHPTSAGAPTATNTAALGFNIAANPPAGEEDRSEFARGLERCARQGAPAIGPSVSTDARLLLGLAAGVSATNESTHSGWLEKHLTAALSRDDVLTSIVASEGLRLMARRDAWQQTENALCRAEPSTSRDAAALLWFLNRHEAAFSESARSVLDRKRKAALSLLTVIDPTQLDELDCALAISVLSRMLCGTAMALERTAIERLGEILRRLPIALAREEQALRNEYDLQRVLWTMLAGVYDDLRDEAWLAQFGVYQPRTDFAVERLKTIVEAKYIRKSSEFRPVQDALTADAHTYTSHPERFDRVYMVIYDASSSGHLHEPMRAALGKLPGVAGVIITSTVEPRPSKRRAVASRSNTKSPRPGPRPAKPVAKRR